MSSVQYEIQLPVSKCPEHLIIGMSTDASKDNEYVKLPEVIGAVD